jgi:hypothetical protein
MDTRKVELIGLSDPKLSDYLSRFQIEKEIYNKLTPTNHIEETEDGMDFRWVDDNLPTETREEIDNKLTELKYIEYTPGLTFRTKQQVLNSYNDVWSLDESKLTKINDNKVTIYGLFIVDSDDDICGFTWIFTSKDFPFDPTRAYSAYNSSDCVSERYIFPFVGMYAIRSNILSVLYQGTLSKYDPAWAINARVSEECDCILRKYKGISKIIINYLQELCKLNGLNKIIVPWPLLDMVPILLHLGFTEFNSYDMSPERKFLKPIAGTSNYFTLDIT